MSILLLCIPYFTKVCVCLFYYYVYHTLLRCVEEGVLLESDGFVVAGKTAADQFSSGKIVG